jgi:hypothetical protein
MAKDDVVGTPEGPQAAPAAEEPSVEVEIIEEELSGMSGRVIVDSLTASTSAIGAVTTGELDASTSAIGGLAVSGDAEISTSAVGVILAKQNVDFRQGWVNDVLSTGNVSVSQGGTAMMIGRSATLENAGSAVLLAGDVKVSRGWIGLLLAGKTEVSEDSHVIIGTRAALIIAAALLGGFGLVAIALLIGSGRVAKQWNPKMLGEWAKHKMPAEWEKYRRKVPSDLGERIPEIIERIKKAAAA